MPHYKTNGGEILLFYGEEGGVNDHLKPFLQYVTTFLSVKSREEEHEKQLNTRQTSNRHESKLRCQNIVTSKTKPKQTSPKTTSCNTTSFLPSVQQQ